jgi:hypothetical protein
MLPLLMTLWLASTPAHAITGIEKGPLLELGAGLGVTGQPTQPALGVHASIGWWAGTYDTAYAFGRYWALVSTTRLDALPAAGTWSLAPMLEVRRGIDIFVANPAFFVSGGPVLSIPVGPSAAGDPLGATGRTGLAFKLRRSRFWGLTLRVEAGVDVVSSTVRPAGGVMVGGGFARPARKMEKTK